MTAGVIFLMSLFLTEDIVPDMPIPGMSFDDNPFVRLIRFNPLWGGMVVYGFVYIYAAMSFREFKLWAYRAIIGLSVLLVILVPIEMTMIFGGLPNSFGHAYMITSFLGLALPVVGLIWFLVRKEIQVHFNA
jgi:hypothetical protein